MNASARLVPLIGAALLVGACSSEAPVARGVAGDPKNGRLLLQQYGCGSCHTIPGVVNARGTVGPPLTLVGKRVYLAGFLPNTPENMARWISEPQEIDPATAMPDQQVPDAHVRDMVAYLIRLR